MAENSTIDPFTFLHIELNPDGSLTRLDARPTVPSTQPINETELGFFKDVPLNDAKKTSLRLFLPLNQTPENKLPVIIYFHGGGFILQSASGQAFHNICLKMTAQFPALVVSVEYRLAPEHRLPAAYNDAVDAILWVRQQALAASGGDPWVREYADISRCFLNGGSSGGNIAYNAGLRAVDLDLKPMKIVGLIVNQPFIGGVQRTASELRLVNDQVLPLAVADLFWDLALPIGADRDHVYSNPISGAHDKEIRRLPSVLIRGFEGDPVVDRGRKLATMLEAQGVRVTSKFREGGVHAADIFDPTKVQVMLDDVEGFMATLDVEKEQCQGPHGPHQHEPHPHGPHQHEPHQHGSHPDEPCPHGSHPYNQNHDKVETN